MKLYRGRLAPSPTGFLHIGHARTFWVAQQRAQAQSERGGLYRAAFEKLREGGFVYPCTCSRQDVLRALQAPHEGEDEPLYPGTCRKNVFSPGVRRSENAGTPHELRDQTNRLTPHPGPLPVEGRGRNAAVQGFKAGTRSENSLSQHLDTLNPRRQTPSP